MRCAPRGLTIIHLPALGMLLTRTQTRVAHHDTLNDALGIVANKMYFCEYSLDLQ